MTYLGRSWRRKFSKKERAEARRQIDATGLTLGQWSERHGVKRQAVIDILRGRGTGMSGENHRAAVALGLKKEAPLPPPVETHICVSKANARTETRGKAGA